MRKLIAGYYVAACVLAGCLLVVKVGNALQSNNFQFNETSLGGIGRTDTQSTSFKALTSGGIIGFGNSADTSFQINSGHETTNDPALGFAVNTTGVNLPAFSPVLTSTSTSTFAVSNYTSFGYVVQILGTGPTYGGHTIADMAATGPSQAGIEQFGINLVANTSPSSFGTNPDQGQFGFGIASANYGTSNNYRYVSGETIASAPKSSGVTAYTVSYIVNVDSLTPSGQYSSNLTFLCTATF